MSSSPLRLFCVGLGGDAENATAIRQSDNWDLLL